MPINISSLINSLGFNNEDEIAKAIQSQLGSRIQQIESILASSPSKQSVEGFVLGWLRQAKAANAQLPDQIIYSLSDSMDRWIQNRSKTSAVNPPKNEPVSKPGALPNLPPLVPMTKAGSPTGFSVQQSPVDQTKDLIRSFMKSNRDERQRYAGKVNIPFEDKEKPTKTFEQEIVTPFNRVQVKGFEQKQILSNMEEGSIYKAANVNAAKAKPGGDILSVRPGKGQTIPFLNDPSNQGKFEDWEIIHTTYGLGQATGRNKNQKLRQIEFARQRMRKDQLKSKGEPTLQMVREGKQIDLYVHKRTQNESGNWVRQTDKDGRPVYYSPDEFQNESGIELHHLSEGTKVSKRLSRVMRDMEFTSYHGKANIERNAAGYEHDTTTGIARMPVSGEKIAAWDGAARISESYVKAHAYYSYLKTYFNYKEPFPTGQITAADAQQLEDLAATKYNKTDAGDRIGTPKPGTHAARLMKSGSVALTALGEKGQDKGHALIVPDSDKLLSIDENKFANIILPYNKDANGGKGNPYSETKPELRYTKGTFIGLEAVSPHINEAHTDPQGLTNNLALHNANNVVGNTRTEGMSLLDQVSDQREKQVKKALRGYDNQEDFEKDVMFAFNEFVASGGNLEDLPEAKRRIVEQFKKKINRHGEGMTMPFFGAGYYLFSDLVGGREVNKGEIDYDPKSGRIFVNSDDYMSGDNKGLSDSKSGAGIASILGGADQDDNTLSMFYKTGENKDIHAVLTRQPSQPGEYVKLKLSAASLKALKEHNPDFEENVPYFEDIDRHLPERIDAMQINAGGEPPKLDTPYFMADAMTPKSMARRYSDGDKEREKKLLELFTGLKGKNSEDIVAGLKENKGLIKLGSYAGITPDPLKEKDFIQRALVGDTRYTSSEGMDRSSRAAVVNESILGAYVNTLMAVWSTFGELPESLPAKLEDVIDSTVKEGKDVSHVWDWIEEVRAQFGGYLDADKYSLDPKDGDQRKAAPISKPMLDRLNEQDWFQEYKTDWKPRQIKTTTGKRESTMLAHQPIPSSEHMLNNRLKVSDYEVEVGETKTSRGKTYPIKAMPQKIVANKNPFEQTLREANKVTREIGRRANSISKDASVNAAIMGPGSRFSKTGLAGAELHARFRKRYAAEGYEESRFESADQYMRLYFGEMQDRLAKQGASGEAQALTAQAILMGEVVGTHGYDPALAFKERFARYGPEVQQIAMGHYQGYQMAKNAPTDKEEEIIRTAFNDPKKALLELAKIGADQSSIDAVQKIAAIKTKAAALPDPIRKNVEESAKMEQRRPSMFFAAGDLRAEGEGRDLGIGNIAMAVARDRGVIGEKQFVQKGLPGKMSGGQPVVPSQTDLPAGLNEIRMGDVAINAAKIRLEQMLDLAKQKSGKDKLSSEDVLGLSLEDIQGMGGFLRPQGGEYIHAAAVNQHEGDDRMGAADVQADLKMAEWFKNLKPFQQKQVLDTYHNPKYPKDPFGTLIGYRKEKVPKPLHFEMGDDDSVLKAFSTLEDQIAMALTGTELETQKLKAGGGYYRIADESTGFKKGRIIGSGADITQSTTGRFMGGFSGSGWDQILDKNKIIRRSGQNEIRGIFANKSLSEKLFNNPNAEVLVSDKGLAHDKIVDSAQLQVMGDTRAVVSPEEYVGMGREAAAQDKEEDNKNKEFFATGGVPDDDFIAGDEPALHVPVYDYNDNIIGARANLTGIMNNPKVASLIKATYERAGMNFTNEDLVGHFENVLNERDDQQGNLRQHLMRGFPGIKEKPKIDAKFFAPINEMMRQHADFRKAVAPKQGRQYLVPEVIRIPPQFDENGQRVYQNVGNQMVARKLNEAAMSHYESNRELRMFGRGQDPNRIAAIQHKAGHRQEFATPIAGRNNPNKMSADEIKAAKKGFYRNSGKKPPSPSAGSGAPPQEPPNLPPSNPSLGRFDDEDDDNPRKPSSSMDLPDDFELESNSYTGVSEPVQPRKLPPALEALAAQKDILNDKPFDRTGVPDDDFDNGQIPPGDDDFYQPSAGTVAEQLGANEQLIRALDPDRFREFVSSDEEFSLKHLLSGDLKRTGGMQDRIRELRKQGLSGARLTEAQHINAMRGKVMGLVDRAQHVKPEMYDKKDPELAAQLRALQADPKRAKMALSGGDYRGLGMAIQAAKFDQLRNASDFSGQRRANLERLTKEQSGAVARFGAPDQDTEDMMARAFEGVNLEQDILSPEQLRMAKRVQGYDTNMQQVQAGIAAAQGMEGDQGERLRNLIAEEGYDKAAENYQAFRGRIGGQSPDFSKNLAAAIKRTEDQKVAGVDLRTNDDKQLEAFRRDIGSLPTAGKIQDKLMPLLEKAEEHLGDYVGHLEGLKDNARTWSEQQKDVVKNVDSIVKAYDQVGKAIDANKVLRQLDEEEEKFGGLSDEQRKTKKAFEKYRVSDETLAEYEEAKASVQNIDQARAALGSAQKNRQEYEDQQLRRKNLIGMSGVEAAGQRILNMESSGRRGAIAQAMLGGVVAYHAGNVALRPMQEDMAQYQRSLSGSIQQGAFAETGLTEDVANRREIGTRRNIRAFERGEDFRKITDSLDKFTEGIYDVFGSDNVNKALFTGRAGYAGVAAGWGFSMQAKTAAGAMGYTKEDMPLWANNPFEFAGKGLRTLGASTNQDTLNKFLASGISSKISDWDEMSRGKQLSMASAYGGSDISGSVAEALLGANLIQARTGASAGKLSGALGLGGATLTTSGMLAGAVAAPLAGIGLVGGADYLTRNVFGYKPGIAGGIADMFGGNADNYSSRSTLDWAWQSAKDLPGLGAASAGFAATQINKLIGGSQADSRQEDIARILGNVLGSSTEQSSTRFSETWANSLLTNKDYLQNFDSGSSESQQAQALRFLSQMQSLTGTNRSSIYNDQTQERTFYRVGSGSVPPAPEGGGGGVSSTIAQRLLKAQQASPADYDTLLNLTSQMSAATSGLAGSQESLAMSDLLTSRFVGQNGELDPAAIERFASMSNRSSGLITQMTGLAPFSAQDQMALVNRLGQGGQAGAMASQVTGMLTSGAGALQQRNVLTDEEYRLLSARTSVATDEETAKATTLEIEALFGGRNIQAVFEKLGVVFSDSVKQTLFGGVDGTNVLGGLLGQTGIQGEIARNRAEQGVSLLTSRASMGGTVNIDDLQRMIEDPVAAGREQQAQSLRQRMMNLGMGAQQTPEQVDAWMQAAGQSGLKGVENLRQKEYGVNFAEQMSGIFGTDLEKMGLDMDKIQQYFEGMSGKQGYLYNRDVQGAMQGDLRSVTMMSGQNASLQQYALYNTGLRGGVAGSMMGETYLDKTGKRPFSYQSLGLDKLGIDYSMVQGGLRGLEAQSINLNRQTAVRQQEMQQQQMGAGFLMQTGMRWGSGPSFSDITGGGMVSALANLTAVKSSTGGNVSVDKSGNYKFGEIVQGVSTGFSEVAAAAKSLASELATAGGALSEWDYQDFQRQQQREQFEFGNQMWQKQRDTQGRQFEERWRVNQQRSGIQYEWQVGDMSRQRGRTMESRQFENQQTSRQISMQQLQFGWQMEDFDENIRFSRGRERRLMMRQRDRAVISHSMEMMGTGEEVKFRDQRRKWEDQDFEREKDRASLKRQWDLEDMEREKRFFDEGRSLELQQHNQEVQWFNERWQMEERYILSQRTNALYQMTIQQQQLNMSTQVANQQYQIQLAQLAISTAMRDTQSRLNEAVASLKIVADVLGNIATKAGAAPTKSYNSGTTASGGAPDGYGGFNYNYSSKSSKSNNSGDEYDDFAGNKYTKWGYGFAPQARFGGFIPKRGYAAGGYTGDGAWSQPAGVVHGGEWVIPAHGAAVIRGDDRESLAELKSIKRILEQILARGRSNFSLNVQTNDIQAATDTGMKLYDATLGVM